MACELVTCTAITKKQQQRSASIENLSGIFGFFCYKLFRIGNKDKGKTQKYSFLVLKEEEQRNVWLVIKDITF